MLLLYILSFFILPNQLHKRKNYHFIKNELEIVKKTHNLKTGSVLFYKNKVFGDTIFIEKQNKFMWHKIAFKKAGKYTFIIKGLDKKTDWDFVVYKQKKHLYKIEALRNQIPIRTNFSRSNITGLSDSVTNHFSGRGITSNFSKSIDVTPNDTFWILVNTPFKGNDLGYSIQTNFVPINEKNKEQTKSKILEKTVSFELRSLDGKPVPCEVLILQDSWKFFLDSASSFKLPYRFKDESLVINIVPKQLGYNYFSARYKVKINNIITLNRFSENQYFTIKGLYFKSSKAALLSQSVLVLERLSHFLIINPDISCTVGGHVNGESFWKNSYKILSKKRAKMVVDYLISKGINPKRLVYKGYGKSKMLFKKPKSERERIQNRRVDIELKTFKR